MLKLPEFSETIKFDFKNFFEDKITLLELHERLLNSLILNPSLIKQDIKKVLLEFLKLLEDIEALFEFPSEQIYGFFKNLSTSNFTENSAPQKDSSPINIADPGLHEFNTLSSLRNALASIGDIPSQMTDGKYFILTKRQLMMLNLGWRSPAACRYVPQYCCKPKELEFFRLRMSAVYDSSSGSITYLNQIPIDTPNILSVCCRVRYEHTIIDFQSQKKAIEIFLVNQTLEIFCGNVTTSPDLEFSINNKKVCRLVDLTDSDLKQQRTCISKVRNSLKTTYYIDNIAFQDYLLMYFNLNALFNLTFWLSELKTYIVIKGFWDVSTTETEVVISYKGYFKHSSNKGISYVELAQQITQQPTSLTDEKLDQTLNTPKLLLKFSFSLVTRQYRVIECYLKCLNESSHLLPLQRDIIQVLAEANLNSLRTFDFFNLPRF